MADIRLAKPAAGTTQTVPSAPNGRFIFDFPADAATLTRNGDDLVLTFEDGSSIQLQGFYTTYSKEEMPSFQVEGVEISGQDFFAALGEDLMPAAGPAASSASRSGRYNEYGGSDLLDGIDHLGRLDIGFDGGTQLATDTVEPSAPEVDIDYEVTITGGIGADGSEMTVYESGLAGGTQAGEAEAPVTANGSLAINAPDGVASIVIGNVVVFANGKLTGNVVTTDEGTLAVTGYDPVTGKLEFSYTLDRNTTEHDKSDPATDTQISHDLTVTVTDTDGDSDSTTITVNVVDDVPVVTQAAKGDATEAENDTADSTLSGSFGIG
ncbi:VWA domain-containing protein, partial [Desulfovibrio sp. SGI.082]